MQKALQLQEVAIGEIFDFPSTNSNITKKFCNHNRGDIPVYASSKDESSVLGYIKENIKGIKYYKNCLSWNRNGSVGYVFIRREKFTTNEDHRVLALKEEYRETLDLEYLKFEIEKRLLLLGFSYLNKCGVDKIRGVEIKVPIKKGGLFDIEKQKEISFKYKEIGKIKKKIESAINQINSSKLDLEKEYEKIEIPLKEVFNIKKGNSKYTKRYIHEHQGQFPVYSSQTSDLGRIGSIDTYDFDERCFTWTTDGTYVGTVFYRDGKFSITTHCGIIRVREVYQDRLSYDYLLFMLNKTLPRYKLGEGSNKRLGIERMEEVTIEIPVNEKMEIDLGKQREIAKKYHLIEKIKKNLKEKYEFLLKAEVDILGEN